MKKYIGVKVVNAEPEQREKWMSNKFEDRDDHSLVDGYKVVYEDGYTSWSPKDVFELAYREMLEFIDTDKSYQPHQDRVILETRELQDKVNKLSVFITTNTIFNKLDIDEQNRLRQQLNAMIYYLTILVERINNF